MKTVLHVIDALNIGGAQELLVLLADKTRAAGYRTLVCCLQPDLTLKNRLEQKGARVFPLDRHRPGIANPWRFFAYALGNIRDLIKICKEHQVDIVHCHLSDAEFLGIIAGRLAGVKRVFTTVHYPALLPERKRGDWRNALRVAVTRMVYREADRVIAVSDDVNAKLREVFHLSPAKIDTIINGIDVARYGATPGATDANLSPEFSPKGKIIISVGRLSPPKGHRHLLAAMPEICRAAPDATLLLVGDGELREELEKLARTLGVAKNVSFMGSRDDIPRLLHLASVFVMPSVSEGTSLALLEAMAAGKPIVATDIPGNRAVLTHEANSLLVTPEDPAAIARAIAFLLHQPEKARLLGSQARRDVGERYGIEKTVARLDALWR